MLRSFSRRWFSSLHRQPNRTVCHAEGQKRNKVLDMLLLEDRVVPANFTPGDFVVYRVGSGSAPLTTVTAAVYLDEYSPNGVLVQSIAMPTVAGTGNTPNPLTSSPAGGAQSFLTDSANGQYLAFAGYKSVTGATLSGNQTIGMVDAFGNINTTTVDTSSDGTVRSAVTDNGTNIWIATSSGGVRYTTAGSNAATTMLTTTSLTGTSNTRVVEIAGGQLYVTTGSSTFIGVNTVGTGLPTTSPPTSPMSQLTGLSNSNYDSSGPYEYYFATLNGGSTPDTVYVADSGTKGILKFSLVGGTWMPSGSYPTTSTLEPVGITGTVQGGTVTLDVTTSAFLTSTNGTVLQIVDSSGYNQPITGNGTSLSTLTPLISAATNTTLHGIAAAPTNMNLSATSVGTVTTTTSPLLTNTSIPFTVNNTTGIPAGATVNFEAIESGAFVNIGSATENAGGTTASGNITFTTAGPYNIVAYYPGDSTHNASYSATATPYTVGTPTPPQITTLSTTFTAGTAGSFQLQATGTGPITYSDTPSTLPSGITLSSSGLLSGTAYTGGTYTFSVTATGYASPPDMETFTLTVTGLAGVPTSTNVETTGPYGAGTSYTDVAGSAEQYPAFSVEDFQVTAPSNATGISSLTLNVPESYYAATDLGNTVNPSDPYVDLYLATGSGLSVALSGTKDQSTALTPANGYASIDPQLDPVGLDGGTMPIAQASYTPSTANTGALTYNLSSTLFSSNPTLYSDLVNGMLTGKLRFILAADDANTSYEIAGYSLHPGPSLFINYSTNPALPIVTSPTDVITSSTTATLGGDVTSTGNLSVVTGVVYSTTDTVPTLGTDTSTQGSTITSPGVFTVPVTNLTPNTLYYYRAYAANSMGTAYSPVSTISYNTTIALTSSVTGSATVGQSLQLTAYVNAGTGNPAPGTVTFFSNGIALPSTGTQPNPVSVDGTSHASYTLTVSATQAADGSGVVPGIDDITANYTPANTLYFANATPGEIAQQVTPNAFGLGDFLAYRVGDGVHALTANGNRLFIDDYSNGGISGALMQSIVMPTYTTGLGNGDVPVLADGAQSGVAQLSLSPDGKYAYFVAYDAPPTNTTALKASTATAIPRVIGQINLTTGAISTALKLTNVASAGNITGVTVAGDSGPIYVSGSTGGVFYIPSYTAGATATYLGGSSDSWEGLHVFTGTAGAELYGATTTASNKVDAIGTTPLPTTTATIAALPGVGVGVTTVVSATVNEPLYPVDIYLTTLGGPSTPKDPNGFDTLYVAEDGLSFNGGTITKWTWNGTTWTIPTVVNAQSATIIDPNYQLKAPNTTGGVDSSFYWLSGKTSGTTVTLVTSYGNGGSTGNSGGGSVWDFTDSGGYNEPFTPATVPSPLNLLAQLTSTSKENFRGVAELPGQPSAGVAASSPLVNVTKDITTPGATQNDPYPIKVTYTNDAGTTVSLSSITGNPGSVIEVTDTATGYTAFATYVAGSATPNSNSASITATYDFTPQDGSWDPTENGTYVVTAIGGTIASGSGSSLLPPITLGSFVVNVPTTVTGYTVNYFNPDTHLHDPAYQAQRSRVTDILLTFNGPVDATMFAANYPTTLTRTDTGVTAHTTANPGIIQTYTASVPTDEIIVTQVSADSVDLTFAPSSGSSDAALEGTSLGGYSLTDGGWTLSVGNGSGTGTPYATPDWRTTGTAAGGTGPFTGLYALFGDSGALGNVDASFAQGGFVAALGISYDNSGTTANGFNAAFDFDGTQTVQAGVAQGAFVGNFGISLT